MVCWSTTKPPRREVLLSAATIDWLIGLSGEIDRIVEALAEMAARTFAPSDAQSVEDLTALLTSAGER